MRTRTTLCRRRNSPTWPGTGGVYVAAIAEVPKRWVSLETKPKRSRLNDPRATRLPPSGVNHVRRGRIRAEHGGLGRRTARRTIKQTVRQKRKRKRGGRPHGVKPLAGARRLDGPDADLGCDTAVDQA
jgi:hypothetical protein